MSDISGEGFGSNHDWERGITAVTSDPMAKNTAYSCKVCGTNFRHYYDIHPNIFEAMKFEDVPENCVKIEGAV